MPSCQSVKSSGLVHQHNSNSTPQKAAFQAGYDVMTAFFLFFMWACNFSRVIGGGSDKVAVR